MASYSTMNTIPADVESEATLLNKPPKASSKVLIGGAALAAFVLGALAATAVDLKAPVRSTTFAQSDDIKTSYIIGDCTGKDELPRCYSLQVRAADVVPR